MNLIRNIILTICCFATSTILAQTGILFDTDNQLSSNFANQVLQDKNGFIWIATRNGLNVYDGYNFTVMRNSDKNGRGFSNNYINCMAQDHQGNLILGTNNAIIRYDGFSYRQLPMYQNNKPVNTYVHHIFVRKNGEVWACTSGYGLVRINKDQVSTTTNKALYKHNYIYYATEDHLGRVWFITEKGEIFRIEKNEKTVTPILLKEGARARELKEDKLGNIYVATFNHGLYIMPHGSNTFTKIEAVGNLPISRIYIGSNNLVYIGCNGLGIKTYSPKTGYVNDNPFFCNRINLSKTKVTSILEDKEGNIWVSMLQKGVFMQPKKVVDFGYMGFRLGNRNLIGENCVTSVLQSKNGTTWSGTDKDGLYRIDNQHGILTSQHVITLPLAILTLCEDQHGNIWIGNYQEGTGYIDPQGTYHPVDLCPGKDLNPFDIKADKYGNLWFATMGQGLVCKKADGTIKTYTVQNGADNNGRINSIPNNYLMKISFSPDHSRIYVATSIGLSCLDIAKDSWVSTFGVNCINRNSFSHCVFADSKGLVWYGTENGIYSYNPSQIKKEVEAGTYNDSIATQHFNTDNGLTDNSIAFITEDARGMIWIGTNHGLCRLNPKTGQTNQYFVESGLQSNEFSDGAVYAAHGGRLLLMGGTGGYNWFDPLNMKAHKWNANVFVTRLIVGNRLIYPEMESGFYTITDKRVYVSDRFDLSHEDNSFTLQLSTLTYNNTEQIAYAYSINGEDWHQLNPGVNEVTFSHMPAGTYHFRIKAISNGQETPVKEFKMVIHPIWYASIPARLVYLVCLIALVVLYMRHRKRKEEDKLLLQKHIHAEEMGEAKLKFFMNISHEIRTPLTLILTPLLALIKEDKEPHRQGNYQIIKKNAERILHLINQMMDLRKIDKGQMAMHMRKTDMVSFINDEYELFKPQATAKNIEFEFNHDCDNLPIWVDQNNFDKVLMNILSNAFKFTHTGGRIYINLRHSEHHAYISIKDNGCGIPKDKLETIFQRFYQSTNDINERNIGTGIGLDLTRSLVELHYGTIVARNNEGERGSDFEHGSEFIVRLPLGKEHLKPEEIYEEENTQNAATTEIAELEKETAEEMDIINTTADLETKKGNKAEIAIVEDEDDILEYLKNQLSNDFLVQTYHNGKEALRGILQHQPDLIISDVMMPEMDGNTLCAKIKANVNTNDIPVILLTAKSREEDQLEGLEMGADAYIMKPFNMDILRRKVINLLTMRRTLRYKFSGKESQDDKIDDVEVQSPDDKLLERIMQVINDNINDSELSVDLIAQKVGISRVHLHRKMKELTNQTPHSFIRNIRLKQAAKLLKESHQSITEVMYACGFSNPASFSTMFKNQYGCSPREYMNQA